MSTWRKDPDYADRLCAENVVVDAAGALLKEEPHKWKHYLSGQTDLVLATVTLKDDVGDTVERLSRWYALFERNQDRLVLARSAKDIHSAKKAGKLAVALHFQNGAPLRRDPWMVDVYQNLGVKTIQLTYNWRNNIGDGCMEPENAGLSEFGRSVIRRMNQNKVLVDLSHTGVRTTLDAMDVSESIDVFTHANARAVYDHPRNLTDEQISKVAEKGGVIGLCGYCGFITGRTLKPTMNDLIDHLDYFVQKVGIDHVGLGIDLYNDSLYDVNVEMGVWDPADYPAPPWHWPLDGTNYPEFVERLLDRGYGESDIVKVLGGNFMRVFTQVWG